MISKRHSLPGAVILCAGLISGCAGTRPYAEPPYPLFDRPLAPAIAFIGEVVLLEEAAYPWAVAVHVRVLEPIHGRMGPYVKFYSGTMLYGAASECPTGYRTVSGPPWTWFAVGDRIIAVTGERRLGKKAMLELGWVRWFAQPHTAGDQDLRRQSGFSLNALVAACQSGDSLSVEEAYALIHRDWAPEAKTLSQTEAEIRDFYQNRRREYWTRWSKEPWERTKKWTRPEGPPPVPGE